MSKVNVYNHDNDIIARVEYNSNLDFWDGSNWTCGSTGRHKGLTKLKNGQFVLIHGTQWQGDRNYAEVISAEQALQEVLSSENEELLDNPRFKDLKKLYEDNMLEEEVINM